jgi:hypothetical protein
MASAPTAARVVDAFAAAVDPLKVALTSNLPETAMTLGTILLIVLVLLLIGAIPSWPYSRTWGYGPSGGLGLVLLVVLVLVVMGRI